MGRIGEIDARGKNARFDWIRAREINGLDGGSMAKASCECNGRSAWRES